MLHFLVGDAVRGKQKAAKLVKGREAVRFGEGGEPFSNALAYLGARGMFSPEIALVLDAPLDDEAGKELLLEHAKELMVADALVIVIARELDAATKKKIPKGAEVESFDDSAPAAKEPPQKIFALSDAFAAGDRKKLWVLYRRFIEDGMAAEPMHGMLASQARAIALAAKTKTASEAGLNPFVYSKAKPAAVRLGSEKAEALSRELVSLYHASRAGEGPLEELLEAFLLKK